MTRDDCNKHDQFLRLYVENEGALNGFVRSMVRTQDDAREVMQDTAVVLWRKFEQLDSPQDFRRWAFGVARFQALAFRRDRARDRHVFSEDLMAMLESEATEAGQHSRREEQALIKCLKKLPNKQSELVKAAYLSGQRIDQMAMAAGRTPMSVYKKLHRIRITLADCIVARLKREDARA
jgi:RNA polymerase sigma-70 factor (ECF subfamily)